MLVRIISSLQRSKFHHFVNVLEVRIHSGKHQQVKQNTVIRMTHENVPNGKQNRRNQNQRQSNACGAQGM